MRMKHSITMIAVFFFLWALTAMGETPGIPISDQPQLFLDDYLVRSMDNLKRTLEKPAKETANPLIVRDRPWERRVIEIYGTVLYDPAVEKYRCWYLGNESKNGIPDNPAHPVTAEYYTCYAESADAIHWTKPPVGSEPFGIHGKHNIVVPGSHGFCVLPTPDDPDPDRKYKGVGGRLFGFSPDGIHWDLRDWGAAVGKNDTSSCVVRWKGEYLAYVRTQVEDPKWPGVMRGVGLCVSKDFETWSLKRTVFTTDDEDGYPWAQPYGISVTPYGDVLIGILWMLHLDRIPNNNSVGDQDTQLVVSRDGRTWRRVADRAVFLGATQGSWDSGRVFPGTTMFLEDDRVHIYYTGLDSRHGEGWGNMGIGLATLPAGRFLALEPEDAGYPGVVETHGLTFSGGDLIVNADVPEEGLQVEVLDETGVVVPGYAREQSTLTRVDSLRFRVTWQGDSAAKTLKDTGDGPVSLRFILGKGRLCAFRIVEGP